MENETVQPTSKPQTGRKRANAVSERNDPSEEIVQQSQVTQKQHPTREDASEQKINSEQALSQPAIPALSFITEILPPLTNKIGDFSGERFFVVAPKPGGVNDGFVAVVVDENFSIRQETFLSQPVEGLTFAEQLYQEGTGRIPTAKGQPSLPLHLIKPYFRKRTSINTVVPPRQRLKKTNAIRTMPALVQPVATIIYQGGKQTTVYNTSLTTIFESLANTIVAAYCGNQSAQQQTLRLTQYAESNSPLQFFLDSLWNNQLRLLEGYLVGSQYHRKYLVKMTQDANGQLIPSVDSQGFHHADSHLRLGFYLPLALVVLIECDIVGSKLQNLAEIISDTSENPEIFFLDLDHAFRSSDVVKKLLPDFTLPTSVYKKYKNYTIFLDSPLHERIAGLLALYIMLEPKIRSAIFNILEMKNLEAMIDEYKKNSFFARRFAKIQSACLYNIFEQYENKLNELAIQHPQHAKKLKKYAEKINTQWLKTLARLKTVFVKFKSHMQLLPNEIDFLDHLEKLCGEVSPLSEDNKVKLNYLRVIKKNVYFSLSKSKNNDFILYFHGKNQDIPRARETIMTFLTYLSQNLSHHRREDVITVMSLFEENSNASLTLIPDSLTACIQCFTEENIVNFSTRERSAKSLVNRKQFPEATASIAKHEQNIEMQAFDSKPQSPSGQDYFIHNTPPTLSRRNTTSLFPQTNWVHSFFKNGHHRRRYGYLTTLPTIRENSQPKFWQRQDHSITTTLLINKNNKRVYWRDPISRATYLCVLPENLAELLRTFSVHKFHTLFLGLKNLLKLSHSNLNIWYYCNPNEVKMITVQENNITTTIVSNVAMIEQLQNWLSTPTQQFQQSVISMTQALR